jgi:hypothetical protein
MSDRHDRNEAGAQSRPGPVGVPGGESPDSQTPTPGNHALGPNDGNTAPMEAVARRTPTGWRVGDEEVPDLTSAMVLADLLAAELSTEEQAELDARLAANATPPKPEAAARNTGLVSEAHPQPPAGHSMPPSEPAGRKPRRGAHRARPAGPAATELGETEQLKETVAQLERALTVRVRVEQAIGVLAERHRLRPRQAFELLRSASRSRGQRIMETASQVIASATNPLLRLPEELAKPPMPRRMARRSRGEA